MRRPLGLSLSWVVLWSVCAAAGCVDGSSDTGEPEPSAEPAAAPADGGDVDGGPDVAEPDASPAAEPSTAPEPSASPEAEPDPAPTGEPAELQGTLQAHNDVRAAALPVPMPALTDLVWSDEAAAVAQAWADNCEWGHNPNRGPYGENIAVFSGANGGSGPATVELWASEIDFYDYDTNSCEAGEQCGHYTQIVWRDTTAVGCAATTCETLVGLENFGTSRFYVCNYSPPGNYVGQRPY